MPDKTATQIKKEIAFNKILGFFGEFIIAVQKHKSEVNSGWMLPMGRFVDRAKIYQYTWLRPAVISDIAVACDANARKLGITFRPLPENEPFFLMLDDVNASDVVKHHGKPGRFIIETSPNNFQVWIKSDRHLENDEKRYWIKKLKADEGADPKHRHGRMPGFIGRKPQANAQKVSPRDFFVRITHITEGKASFPVIDPQELNRLVPRTATPDSKPVLHRLKDIPLPSREKFDRGDESRTDFAYCMALAWRGKEDFEIVSLLQHNRPDWSKYPGARREQYIRHNVKRAVEQVDKIRA